MTSSRSESSPGFDPQRRSTPRFVVHSIPRQPNNESDPIGLHDWSTDNGLDEATSSKVSALLGGEPGLWQVTGPAGSGVTTLLADVVIAHINQGLPATAITMVAGSKEQAAELKNQLYARVPQQFIGGDNLVRSVHSLAFAIVRADALSRKTTPPRMITGAEHDEAIRQLLVGDAHDGSGDWPEDLRPALTVTSFGRGLRDLILRATERGLQPADLKRFGVDYNIPIWRAAATLWMTYQRVEALSEKNLLTAAELVHKACNLLENNDELADQLADYTQLLVIDDAHNLDPAAEKLLTLISKRARITVIGGDAKQSVFHFRGARQKLLQAAGANADHAISLPASRRTPATVKTLLAPDPGTHAEIIADFLRRRHHREDVSYSDMAIIVRSPSQAADLMRRLAALDIPVIEEATDVTIATRPLTQGLLTTMRAVTEKLNDSVLQEIASSPISGADPIVWRSLLRGIHKQAEPRGLTALELMEEILHYPQWLGSDSDDDTEAESATDTASDALPEEMLPQVEELKEAVNKLAPRETTVLRQLHAVYHAGRESYERGDTVEEVLWAIWDAAGLAEPLTYQALSGGHSGARAHTDLDAVMTLFDMAGDYTEHRPGAGVQGFVNWVESQDLPIVGRVRYRHVDAVNLLSAHASVGREWDTVVVAGVQENDWPSTGITGSLFLQEELVDLLDNDVNPHDYVARTAERVAEEYRLFHVATTRATGALLTTAIDNPEGDPSYEVSRFVDEKNAELITPEKLTTMRMLSPDTVIAELRRCVCDVNEPDDKRRQAARQLVRLAEAGVPGADPDSWWGGFSLEHHEQEATNFGTVLDEPVVMSPSQVEASMSCPLRSQLSWANNEDDDVTALVRGIMLHAVAEKNPRGDYTDDDINSLTEAWLNYEEPAPYLYDATRDEMVKALVDLRALLANRTTSLVGVEVPVSVDIDISNYASGHDDESPTTVRIKGRLDRLDQTADGGMVVVDFKTGKSKPSVAKASSNVQLATYQRAIVDGCVVTHSASDGDSDAPVQPAVTVVTRRADETPLTIDHAELVFPRVTGSSTLTQAAWDEEQLAELTHALAVLAQEKTALQQSAYYGESCTSSSLAAICAMIAKQQVTTYAPFDKTAQPEVGESHS